MITRIKFLLILMVALFLNSCADLSKEAESKLRELQTKTNSLDSIIRTEVDKVASLDSLINSETDKLKSLDSLVNQSTSKIDSITRDKVKVLERVLK